MNATRAVVVSGTTLALMIGMASAARAQEFVALTVEDEPAADDPERKTRIVWFSTSVGFDFFAYDFSAERAQLGLAPGVGYGIKWKPPWYDTTSALAAFDVFVQALAVDEIDSTTDAMGAQVQLDGVDFFNIDLIGSLTIVDWIGVGVGLRFKFPLQDELERDTAVLFTFGLRTSTTGPDAPADD